MVIRYLGHSAFRLKGSTASVITDPFDSRAVGMQFPRTSAEIVTVSHAHSDHNQVSSVGGDPFVIIGPGEYEVKGVRIHGITTFHDQEQGAKRGENIIYLFTIDSINLLHCGDLGHKLSEEQLEHLGNVDILLIPVGGVFTVDPAEAAAITAQIEPKIVIPMHYHTQKLNQASFGQLAGMEKFLAELGKEDVVRTDKLVIAESSLPEEMEVVVFST